MSQAIESKRWCELPVIGDDMRNNRGDFRAFQNWYELAVLEYEPRGELKLTRGEGGGERDVSSQQAIALNRTRQHSHKISRSARSLPYVTKWLA